MNNTDKNKKKKVIGLNVAERMDEAMKKLIKEEGYENRSEVVRKAVEGLLKRES